MIILIVTTVSTGSQIDSSWGYQKWKYLCYVLLLLDTSCCNIHTTQIQYLRLYFSRDVCIVKGTRQRWLINICLFCLCVLHLASLSQQQHWLRICVCIFEIESVKKIDSLHQNRAGSGLFFPTRFRFRALLFSPVWFRQKMFLFGSPSRQNYFYLGQFRVQSLKSDLIFLNLIWFFWV